MPQIKEDQLIAESYNKILSEITIPGGSFDKQPLSGKLGELKVGAFNAMELVSPGQLIYPIDIQLGADKEPRKFNLVEIFNYLHNHVKTEDDFLMFSTVFHLPKVVRVAQEMFGYGSKNLPLPALIKQHFDMFMVYIMYGDIKELDIPGVGKIPTQKVLTEFSSKTNVADMAKVDMKYHLYTPALILRDMLSKNAPIKSIAEFMQKEGSVKKQPATKLPPPPPDVSRN